MNNNINTKINAYLIFKVGEDEFAVNAGKVQRILELQPVTSIPKAPVYMKGVINLMGSVLPVIDARLKMGMEEKEPDSNTCIVVLEVEKQDKIVETGIIVDLVQSVMEIPQEEIKGPLSLGVDANADFIQGMFEHDNKFIMILDIDNIFSIEEVITLKQIVDFNSKSNGEEQKSEKQKAEE
jgi:purine-binding chemotaxis protein CheW